MINADTVAITPNAVNNIFRIPFVLNTDGNFPLYTEAGNLSVVVQGHDINGPVLTSLYSDFFVGLTSTSRELNFSGTVGLVDGLAVVETLGVGLNSVIMLTYQNLPVDTGILYVGERINGVSFKICSSNTLDANTVGWCIVKQ